jgi:hypothetical protein
MEKMLENILTVCMQRSRIHKGQVQSNQVLYAWTMNPTVNEEEKYTQEMQIVIRSM